MKEDDVEGRAGVLYLVFYDYLSMAIVLDRGDGTLRFFSFSLG